MAQHGSYWSYEMESILPPGDLVFKSLSILFSDSSAIFGVCHPAEIITISIFRIKYRRWNIEFLVRKWLFQWFRSLLCAEESLWGIWVGFYLLLKNGRMVPNMMIADAGTEWRYWFHFRILRFGYWHAAWQNGFCVWSGMKMLDLSTSPDWKSGMNTNDQYSCSSISSMIVDAVIHALANRIARLA